MSAAPVGLGVCVLFLGGLASPAAAQGGELTPVRPSTAAGARADGVFERAGDLRGGELGAGAFGSVAPLPWLELGAALGARASWVGLRDGARRGRVGLVPVALTVGAGRSWSSVSFAVRLRGGAGPGVVGAEGAGSNGERAFAQLEGALGWARGGFDGRLGVRGAYALSGSSGHGGLGSRLSLSWARPGWRLRPFASGWVVVASDLGWGASGELGVLASLGRHSIRLALRGPLAPVGQWFGVSVGWRVDLEGRSDLRA